MRRLLLLASTALVATAACVTINVYFPSAEAAEAADRIIDEVRGATDAADESAVQLGIPDRLRRSLTAFAVSALDFVVPAAHAQVDFNASSPATRSLEASLKKRFTELKPYYQSGAIGVTREATVAIRDRNLVPLPERSRVLKLVADQNADWNALYIEIAKANNHPEWESQIRSTFAERNVAKLESGWWYQDSAGGWKQK